MSKILIIYGSTTGNCEALAEGLEEVFVENGHEVLIGTGADHAPAEMKDFDFTFIGSSTWGDGDIQDEMVDFVEAIKEESLAGIKVAVFGNGMSSFPKFCQAVDDIEEALEEAGADIIGESIKVDGDVYDEMDSVKDWAKEIVS